MQLLVDAEVSRVDYALHDLPAAVVVVAYVAAVHHATNQSDGQPALVEEQAVVPLHAAAEWSLVTLCAIHCCLLY